MAERLTKKQGQHLAFSNNSSLHAPALAARAASERHHRRPGESQPGQAPGVEHGREGRFRLLRIIAACLVLGAAESVTAETRAVLPVSAIQVPVELDLAPLFAAVESSLPTQAGHWPGWRKWHGVETRYRAWRGPLALAMQGELLLVQAHVRYQAEARKGLLGGIQLSAGCGVKEPPRQALIGVLARLEWTPDWSLHPRFQVLPTRFLDRCEVTVADIDVSPLMGRVFEDRLEASLKEEMRALTPRLQRLRAEAARAWQATQTPKELSPGLWLHLQPLALALAPLQGSGSHVQTALWLALRIALSADRASPAVAPTPLPPLVPFRPTAPGLRFALGLKLDYPGVSAALSERVAGEELNVKGHRARLTALSLAARGQDLVLSADLAGDLAGRVKIMARPGFDAAAQALKLEQVDFIFDATDPDQGLMANLFYKRIRDRIEQAASDLLAARTQNLRAVIEATLAQDLPPALAPDLAGMRIMDLGIQVGEGGISLSGVAAGTLTLGTSRATQ
jgi:hypothetical protein